MDKKYNTQNTSRPASYVIYSLLYDKPDSATELLNYANR